jgi:hypothetical protein
MCLNVIGYYLGRLHGLARARREKVYMHFIMLGSAPDWLFIYGTCSRLDIHNINYNIFLCLTCRGPTSGPCHWVGYAPKSYLTQPTRQESSETTWIVQNNPDKVRRGSDKFKNNSDWLKTTQTGVQTTRTTVKTTRHGLEARISQQGVLRHYTTKLEGSPSLRPCPGGSGFKDGGCKNQDSSHHSTIIKDYNKLHNTTDPSSELFF